MKNLRIVALKNYFLILLLVLTGTCLFGQDAENTLYSQQLDTARLNKIAKQASREDKSWTKVARLIDDSCKSELEKVYTIYTYIGEYYKYDLRRLKLIYKREIKRELYLSEVIKKKKGVCGDFANLFVTLCDSMDIGCFRVSGYSKTMNLFHPVRKNYYNHSWNVVRIDGKWYPVDVTFGIRHFTKKKWDRDQINYNFLLTDPVLFGKFHLPADPAFQLVRDERSYKDFRYRHFLPSLPAGSTSEQDSVLNRRLRKEWKDQLLDEASKAQAFNKKVKGAGLKLLEIRINKVLDKKTKRKQILTKRDYDDAIYLYQGVHQDMIRQQAKRKYIRYAAYRIQVLQKEKEKLKK